MAVPKRRTSVSRRNKRRSHHALKPMAVNTCPNCGELARPHRVCESCGTYKGVQIAVGADD